MTLTIGTKVIDKDNASEDRRFRDRGVILKTGRKGSKYIPAWANDGKHVFVGWESGVNTWTDKQDLKAIDDRC